MNKNKNIPEFFLGSNSPTGFFSYFDNLYYPNEDWFCYILKGGPGCGKSSLMKKIALIAAKKKISMELIHCPSDPSSLDAVIFPEMKISIVDGTAPHTIDPEYPGAADKIINLGEYWSSHNIAAKKEEIIRLTSKSLLYRTRATGYLNAFRSIKNDILNIASKAVNMEKTIEYSNKLAKKLFKKVSNFAGSEKVRFISAITPDGIVFFEDTLIALCDQIYVIDDPFGVISPIILDCVKNYAVKLGHDVITCYCPISPKNKVDCIIFPQDGITFAVSNMSHSIEKLKSIGKRINSRRFLNKKIISNHARLLNFDKKIERELLSEVINNLNKAKSIHDDIEEMYVPSMNFSLVDKIADDIADEIFKN